MQRLPGTRVGLCADSDGSRITRTRTGVDGTGSAWQGGWHAVTIHRDDRQRESRTVSDDLLSDLPRVIAHRGASGEAPENTLAAVRLAAQQGARWVEVDVMVSADGRVVLHHDNWLDRCTDGSGWLLAKDYAELSVLDAGGWFGARYAGEPLATLEQLWELVERLGLGLNIEIKPVSGWEEPTAEAVCECLRRLRPERVPLLISSFSLDSLRIAMTRLPEIPRGYLASVVPPNWQERMRLADCISMHCHHYQVLDQDTAAAVKDAGKVLLCFTVNEVADAQRLMSWGVDSVISDYPGRIIAAIGT